MRSGNVMFYYISLSLLQLPQWMLRLGVMEVTVLTPFLPPPSQVWFFIPYGKSNV